MNIVYNESFEFINALYAVGQESMIRKMLKAKPLINYDKQFDTMLKKIKKNTSEQLMKSIKYFYDIHGIGYLVYNLIFIYEKQNSCNQMPVDIFVEALTSLTYENALGYLISSNFNIDYLTLDANLASNKMNDLLDLVVLPETNRQKRLKDLLENHELFQELIQSTTDFYNKVYIKLKSEIDHLCSDGVLLYQSIFDKNPEAFYSYYLGNSDPLTENDSVHISFFSQIGLHDYESKWEKRRCIILGIHHCDLFTHLDPLNKLAYYYKVLSDPKRLELIRLIARRPYFGQELASALNIAVSTTSYHLNMLMDIQLVKTNREYKKVYFSFNKEEYIKINQLFDLYLDS